MVGVMCVGRHILVHLSNIATTIYWYYDTIVSPHVPWTTAGCSIEKERCSVLDCQQQQQQITKRPPGEHDDLSGCLLSGDLHRTPNVYTHGRKHGPSPVVSRHGTILYPPGGTCGLRLSLYTAKVLLVPFVVLFWTATTTRTITPATKITCLP
jgi:hypothetical protein